MMSAREAVTGTAIRMAVVPPRTIEAAKIAAPR